MFYEIMSLRSHKDMEDYRLELNRSGNKYVIYFEGDSKEGRAHMRGEYSSIDEAMKRYMKGVELIGKSYGDFAYKCVRIFGSADYKTF